MTTNPRSSAVMVLGMLTLLSLSGGCSRSTATEPVRSQQGESAAATARRQGRCSLDGLEASTDKDWVRMLRAASLRCTPWDECLLACLRSGCGEQVAGGCFHLCSVVSPNADSTRVRLARTFRANPCDPARPR